MVEITERRRAEGKEEVEKRDMTEEKERGEEERRRRLSERLILAGFRQS